MYFRSEAVLGLPVRLPLTPGMRLVQFNPRSALPATDRSLIDTDGAKTPRNPVLLPYLHLIIIPRLVSIFLHSIIIPIAHVPKYKDILYLASNRRLLDFYPIARE